MRRYTLEDLRLQMKEVLEVHMGITPLKENLPWYHIQHLLQGHRSTVTTIDSQALRLDYVSGRRPC